MNVESGGHEPSCRCAGVRRRRARVAVFVRRGNQVLGHVLWTTVLVSFLFAVGGWWTWRQSMLTWVLALVVVFGCVGALGVVATVVGADVDPDAVDQDEEAAR